MKSIFVFLISVFLLSGCGSLGPGNKYSQLPTFGSMYSKTVVLAYEGNARPLSEVGVVSHDLILNIVSVNGKTDFANQTMKISGVYPTGPNQLHLLPGAYNIEFCFKYVETHGNSQSAAQCTSTITKSIELKAGQAVFFSWIELAGNRWSIAQSDMDNEDKTKLENDFRELAAAGSSKTK